MTEAAPRPLGPQEPTTTPQGPDALVERLTAVFHEGGRASVTWLNHYSVQRAFAVAGAELQTFDFVGIDGKLLQLLVAGTDRTSADLVVPRLLGRLDHTRVGVVGGTAELLNARADAISGLLPRSSEVVWAIDGYDELPSLERFGELVAELRLDVVLIGLGAGLQERYATAARRSFRSRGLSVTCGGMLDQLLVERYYPAWAYPLRLNWLVRLAREPRRLWRRYTMDAMRAVAMRAQLRSEVQSLPGLWV